MSSKDIEPIRNRRRAIRVSGGRGRDYMKPQNEAQLIQLALSQAMAVDPDKMQELLNNIANAAIKAHSPCDKSVLARILLDATKISVEAAANVATSTDEDDQIVFDAEEVEEVYDQLDEVMTDGS